MTQQATGRTDDQLFVPADFDVPAGYWDKYGITGEKVRLEPLGPEHNDRDYQAWHSDMEHVQRTPGFEDYGWPREMSPDEKHGDLVGHREDFQRRRGFTYSVIVSDNVIGCVYIYPSGEPGRASVRSWVRKDWAHLDEPLYRLVNRWLREDWPFSGYSYSARTAEDDDVY